MSETVSEISDMSDSVIQQVHSVLFSVAQT